jgi:hypothetical protein
MKGLMVVGTLVGLALGLLSSGMDILIWTSMGRPAVLVRPGWERVHIAVGIFCGLVVGLIYGTVLFGIVSPERFRKNAVFIVPGTFLFATVAYAAGALLSIRAMNIFPSMGAHAVVFLAMLLIARVTAGPLQAPSE